MSLTITIKSLLDKYWSTKTAWRVNLEFSSWNISVEPFVFPSTPVKAIRVFKSWKIEPLRAWISLYDHVV